MTADGLKNYFGRVFATEGHINKLCEEIDTLRARQEGAGAILGRNGSKTRNHRHGEDMAVAILELETDITKAKIALLGLEKEIKSLADGLDSPIGRAVITWRYICRYKWKDIAQRAYMSEMQVIREHNAAMNIMAKETAPDKTG
ncbi:MAG: hypothetical protein FWC93_04390 [Defluviitaleaceae bacterium]|nr:hypothetical protein [Defluviitaleaceae bacterium]